MTACVCVPVRDVTFDLGRRFSVPVIPPSILTMHTIHNAYKEPPDMEAGGAAQLMLYDVATYV